MSALETRGSYMSKAYMVKVLKALFYVLTNEISDQTGARKF